MPGRIPTDFIDRLLARVDIVELIDARVPLKKAGQEYMARCPFHTEKTPSFTVSPAKQFYHCFGCGAHGSAISFLMEYERLNFYEAVEDLAARAGMELPTHNASGSQHDNSNLDSLEPAYVLLARVDAWFRQQLRTHPDATLAVNYLKGRGLTGLIAAEYGLGYGPPGWDRLRNAFGGDATKLLVENGLLGENSGRYYDRFRNRIIFPIRDRRGRTIGFGGRVLDDDKPKYLNSPETPLFHKGKELYGLFEARKALRRIDQLVIVEGYLDVIALAQFGIHNVVATLGTATTVAHLEQLFRVCQRLIFCFDGDQAGRDAAWKAINTALPMVKAEREIQFLFLPEGEDPDTFVRQVGTTAFEQYLANAKPFSEVLFDHLGAKLDLKTIDGRARFAEQARPLIEQIPPGIYQDMLVARLGQLTGLPTERLGIQQRLPTRPLAQQPVTVVSDTAPLTLVQRAFAILIQHPNLAPAAAQVPSEWRRLQQPNAANLVMLLDFLQTQPELTTAALVERWRVNPDFEIVQQLAQYDLKKIVGIQQDLAAELTGSLHRLNALVQNQATTFPFGNSRPSDLSAEQKAYVKNLLTRK